MPDTAAATTAATQANTPKWVDDPIHPGQGAMSYPTPPAYGGGVNDLGGIGRTPKPVIQTAAGAVPATTVGTGQTPRRHPRACPRPPIWKAEGGGEDGQDYAAISRPKPRMPWPASARYRKWTICCRLHTWSRCAAADEARCRRASHGRRSGHGAEASRASTQGDAEAFQKGTAALAGGSGQTGHNRVTQTEFKVFSPNNPTG